MPRAMNSPGVWALLLAACCLMSCSLSNTNKPSPGGESQPQALDQTLSKYSDKELLTFMTSRRSKSLHNDSHPEMKGFSDGQILDYMIYRQKTLYGTDRRKEFFEIQDPMQLTVTNSVAALVREENFDELSASYRLKGPTLGEEKSLCSGQDFFSQPEVADCTGFVIGPDMIATAGHCVPEVLSSIRIVFGYRAIKPTKDIRVVTEIPKSEVYKVLEVVDKKYDGPDSKTIDYAILRVDRKIKDHLPLPLDLDTGVTVGNELYTIGFPTGLPMKLADQAFVRSVHEKGYFVSNLDTFGGNSGSPVIRAGTLTVEGILVRGDGDYVYRGNCQIALVCPRDRECRNEGEDATSLKAIASAIKKLEASSSASSNAAPFTKTFSSGEVLSGVGKSFSQEYRVVSDPPPPGYTIASYLPSLSGDRACNAWSTCSVSLEGERAVFRFTLQGHDEWPFPGQGKSVGNLVVTYAPRVIRAAPAALTTEEKAQTLKRDGETLMRSGKLDEAEKKFRKALALGGISSGLQSQLNKLVLDCQARRIIQQ
jgi:hypothetical protein